AFCRAVLRARIHPKPWVCRISRGSQIKLRAKCLHFLAAYLDKRRKRLRVGAERGHQTEVMMNMMRALGWWRACRGALLNQSPYFRIWAFAHRCVLQFWRHGTRQHPSPSAAGITHPLRNSSQPKFQRRARRIGKHDAKIIGSCTESARHTPQALAFLKRLDVVEGRMT